MTQVILEIVRKRAARKLALESLRGCEAAMSRRACYILASARYFEQGDRLSAARMMRLAWGELTLAKALRRGE